MMIPSPDLGTYVNRCVEHALTVLQPHVASANLFEGDVEVNLFKQGWPNTACGWPGVSGQALTDAYTIVVIGPHGDAVVYLGRPAYYLPSDVGKRDKFYECLAARQMPAVRDCATIACKRFLCCVCIRIGEYTKYTVFSPDLIPYVKVICDSCGLSFCTKHSKVHSDTFCVFQAMNGIYGVLPKDWETIK